MATLYFLVFILLSFPACIESSIEMTCAINHMGKVYFHFPNVTRTAILYYRRNKGQWKKVVRSKNLGRFLFLQQDLMYLGSDMLMSSYDFMISTVKNKKTENITDIYFSKTKFKISPWLTRSKIRMCQGGFGMKYVAHYASHDHISLEWYRYPVDEFFQITKKFIVHIKGPKMNKKIILKAKSCAEYADPKDCNCQRDFCWYKYNGLKSCTNYKVCVNAFHADYAVQKECREIKTYCKNKMRERIIWKEALIVCFGLIISLTFSIYVYVRCKQQNETAGFAETDVIAPRSQTVASADSVYTDVISICDKNYLLRKS